jgi:F-type H+-transporting ATPase subunit a
MVVASANNVDFMIKGVFKFHAFGQELWVTTTEIGMSIVTVTLLIIAVIANSKMKKAADVPGTFQNIIEYVVETLDKMVYGTMGHNAKRFINYIGTIFLFILFCNIGGLFGLRTPTGDFGVTFMLGIFTFCMVQYQGIKNHGIGHLTSMFKPFPVLFPINLIGEITNPLSQALRLFGNMMSGVVIMGLWYGMMPIFVKIGIPSFLHVYCDLFSGCIQTYVFCMLTMVYVSEKMD